MKRFIRMVLLLWIMIAAVAACGREEKASPEPSVIVPSKSTDEAELSEDEITDETELYEGEVTNEAGEIIESGEPEPPEATENVKPEDELKLSTEPLY